MDQAVRDAMCYTGQNQSAKKIHLKTLRKTTFLLTTTTVNQIHNGTFQTQKPGSR